MGNHQVALILKDVYDFKIKEIAAVIWITVSVAKHLLHNARKTMIEISDDTCALSVKKGVCDQCSGLNGKFNPKEDRQAKLMKLKMGKKRPKYNTARLYALRVELVKAIDPLLAGEANLYEAFMKINHRVNPKPA